MAKDCGRNAIEMMRSEQFENPFTDQARGAFRGFRGENRLGRVSVREDTDSTVLAWRVSSGAEHRRYVLAAGETHRRYGAGRGLVREDTDSTAAGRAPATESSGGTYLCGTWVRTSGVLTGGGGKGRRTVAVLRDWRGKGSKRFDETTNDSEEESRKRWRGECGGERGDGWIIQSRLLCPRVQRCESERK